MSKSRDRKESLDSGGWEFVDTIEGCQDIGNLADVFSRCIAEYGYSASACGAFHLATEKGDRLKFYFRNWPERWAALYAQRNFALHDFTISEARRKSGVYSWLPAKLGRQLSPKENMFWEAMGEFGWTDGLSIPIHGPRGQLAFVTMAGSSQLLTPIVRARLQFFALLTHARARAILQVDPERGPRDLLTPRELECLRKVGAGKSDRAIGEELGIARTTVKYYLEHARQKLGVRTRAQALAQLVLWGDE
ncbi:MAG: LuxR family transcriptional regulator [Proteobacteria bacterium]|nr:LuxR family transcriptional regulator [Pseudomonadota bacterium]